ncbi:MAG: hypothetical protein JRH11_02725 [Deltaproteobacteria bacterium]|nr:hypothetical protein [Deltaproteobacteria bacterium]
MKAFKQIILFFFGGALVGVAVGSVVAPKFVAFRTSNQGALCNCRDIAEEVTSAYIHSQLGGVVIGGLLGFALWVVLRRKGKLA